MRLVNASGSTLKTPEFGGLVVPPGSEVEIDDGYCRPGLNPNGSRRQSIVEMAAPCLVPVDPERRKTWGKDLPQPVKVEPTTEQVAAELVAEKRLPPAAAQLVAQGKRKKAS